MAKSSKKTTAAGTAAAAEQENAAASATEEAPAVDETSEAQDQDTQAPLLGAVEGADDSTPATEGEGTESPGGNGEPGDDPGTEGGENGEENGEKLTAAQEKSEENKKTCETERQRWAFPTVNRCPRCGANDTQATSTQGDRQYRRCVRPVCRKTFTIFGKKV